MKIYRFNSENYCYLGEDFCVPAEIVGEEGITTIAPPAPVAGYTPVFDPQAGQWSLVSLDKLTKSVKSS